MSARDGGPAFPSANERRLEVGDSTVITTGHPGLSARDFFAAAALQAVDVQAHVASPAAAIIASSAYAIADAMLAERAKGAK